MMPSSGDIDDMDADDGVFLVKESSKLDLSSMWNLTRHSWRFFFIVLCAVIFYVGLIFGLQQTHLFSKANTYYEYLGLIIVLHTLLIFWLGRVIVSTIAYPYNN